MGHPGGGLYLALQDAAREKDKILKEAAQEGGTVVSDGAKLKSRKRGMLNTGRLAQIKDWGEIDLCLDLKSEHVPSMWGAS